MAAASFGPRVWSALWAVYLVWGSTYLGIKFGVATLPAFPMLAIRFFVAGAILLGWCARRGLPRPTRRQWLDAAVIGTCLAALGNGGVAFAETRIDSGLAALIVAVIPLWIALIGRVFLGNRLSRRGVVGIAVGLVGVAVLVDPAGASAGDLVAAVVVLGGSFAWAAGSIYATTTTPTDDPLVGVAMQMVCAGAVLAAMGAGEWSRLDVSAVSTKSLLALVYLILVGSVIGYTAYGWLLHNAPAPLVATYAYVNPVIAVLLGTLLAGEALTVSTLIGGAVIVAAVMLIVTARPAAQPVEAEPAVEPVREAA